MTLFLKESSFNSIFTQVSKTLNSTVALLVGFLKHLGDVVTVLLDLVCLSLFCYFMSFQRDWWWSDQISVWSTGCCQTPCADNNLTALLQLMTKIMFGNVNLIFPTDTLPQKIEITDLKPFFVGENTSGLRLLHSTVYICIIIFFFYMICF